MAHKNHYQLRVFKPSYAQTNAEMPDLLRGVPRNVGNCRMVAIVLRQNDIHWLSTRYLLGVALSSTSQTGDTQGTYGECLIDYLTFNDIQSYDLGSASELSIQSYRNWLVEERALSAATVNLRVTVAISFHIWAERRGLLASRVSQLNQRSPHEGKQTNYWKAHAKRNGIFVPAQERIPRLLKAEEVRKFFDRLEMPLSLMFKWSLSTGIRRFELCELMIENLPSREQLERGMCELYIRRKGGSSRRIFVPQALLNETWRYVLTERPKSLYANVFVLKNGKPFRREYLSTLFKKRCRHLFPQSTLHHLRHTFAVTILSLLQELEKMGSTVNPLKTVQTLLGHKSIDTTQVYLRSVDVHSEEVERALHYLYGSDCNVGDLHG